MKTVSRIDALKGLLKEIYLLVPNPMRRKLKRICFLQVVVALLDLFAIAAFGYLVSGLSQLPSQSWLIQSVDKLGQKFNFTFNETITYNIIGFTVLLLFLLRSLLSLMLYRRLLFLLAGESAKLSSSAFTGVISQSWSFISSISSKQVAANLNQGINVIFMGVLSSIVTVLVELFLLVSILVFLALIQPLLTVLTLVYFSILVLTFQIFVSKKNIALGQERWRKEVSSNTLAIDVLRAFRELRTLNAQTFFHDKFLAVRRDAIHALAQWQYLMQIPKYILEFALIGALSFFVLARNVSFLPDVEPAILALFVVAATRIMPSLLRLQQSYSNLEMNLAPASESLHFLSLLDSESGDLDQKFELHELIANKPSFIPRVEFVDVEFSYDREEQSVLSNCSFELEVGQVTAITDDSGVGKSTLIDIMLGFSSPIRGKVEISGTNPQLCMAIWPGKIGVVPQEVNLLDATVRENIAFGIDSDKIDDERIWEVLRECHLDDFFKKRDGLNCRIGENGQKLSGGQRQRLGVARCLYFEPELIILDEATRSLDEKTESAILKVLASKVPRITLVFITHRKSSLKFAHKIINLTSEGLTESLIVKT